MDLLLPVFQLLYFVVHFLYSLAQAVVDCFYELYHVSFNYLFWKSRFKPSDNQIRADASNLKKIPQHLGFILTSVQINSYKHICHVINWSIQFGIHTMSLYDVNGILKLKLPSLLDNLAICSDVTIKVIVDDQIYVRESLYENCESANHIKNPPKKEWSNGLRNVELNAHFRRSVSALPPRCDARVITINILCVEDGKENIVDSVKTAYIKNNERVDTEFIQSNLITKGQLDPDLVLIIGCPTCTLGFLPWQIRLTEFLTVPSITRLDYQEFNKQLLIYSRCQQRCGS